jgi:hypothetical protein
LPIDVSTAIRSSEILFSSIVNKRSKLEELVHTVKIPHKSGVCCTLLKHSTSDPFRVVNWDEIQGIIGCPYEIRELTSAEVRKGDSMPQIISAACRALCRFSEELFEASISDELKISVFHDLNIIGYLFDRSPENFKICRSLLDQFLWKLFAFKAALSAEALVLWNESTFPGTTDLQVQLLRSLMFQGRD